MTLCAVCVFLIFFNEHELFKHKNKGFLLCSPSIYIFKGPNNTLQIPSSQSRRLMSRLVVAMGEGEGKGGLDWEFGISRSNY